MKVADLRARVGGEAFTSRWFLVDQARIDAFADVTEDWQHIHCNPEEAAKTPFGTTIAHGFLTVSLLSAMIYDAVPEVEGMTMGVNYGFDKLRFLAPVKCDDRIRAVFRLSDLVEKPGQITEYWDVTIEIEGGERPALIARWIGRTYLEENA